MEDPESFVDLVYHNMDTCTDDPGFVFDPASRNRRMVESVRNNHTLIVLVALCSLSNKFSKTCNQQYNTIRTDHFAYGHCAAFH